MRRGHVRGEATTSIVPTGLIDSELAGRCIRHISKSKHVSMKPQSATSDVDEVAVSRCCIDSRGAFQYSRRCPTNAIKRVPGTIIALAVPILPTIVTHSSRTIPRGTC